MKETATASKSVPPVTADADKITQIRRTFYRHADWPLHLFGSKKELNEFLAHKARQARNV